MFTVSDLVVWNYHFFRVPVAVHRLLELYFANVASWQVRTSTRGALELLLSEAKLGKCSHFTVARSARAGTFHATNLSGNHNLDRQRRPAAADDAGARVAVRRARQPPCRLVLHWLVLRCVFDSTNGPHLRYRCAERRRTRGRRGARGGGGGGGGGGRMGRTRQHGHRSVFVGVLASHDFWDDGEFRQLPVRGSPNSEF